MKAFGTKHTLTNNHYIAREQVWPNPGFQEQLVLFELCQYNPTVTNGIYVNWRRKIERILQGGSA